MSELQRLQAPIDRAIVDSMIDSVPEEWPRITLVIERVAGSTAVGDFVHELSSPDGYAPVIPDDSLYAATYQLDELLQSHSALLKRAVYEVTFTDTGARFKGSFEYAGANAERP
jgi:hypothetical protein